MLKNYKITLDVLAPVFIGSGETVSKKDCLYLSNERRVYILNHMKIFNVMKKVNLLKEYEEFLMDDSQKNFSVFTRLNSVPLNTVKECADYFLPMNDITDVDRSRKNGGGSDNIALFVKDKFGKPYIPGSSLKGALRTAIQNAKCIEERENFDSLRTGIESEKFEGKKKYLSSYQKQISTRLFFNLGRKPDKRNDIINDEFAGIRISDSLPLDVSSLILCQKIDFKPDGSFVLLPIKRECLKPGTRVEFKLEIDTDFVSLSPEKICEYARNVFDEYNSDFLSKFEDRSIKTLDILTPLVLGGGAGYVSKTSLYSLYENKKAAVKTVQNIMIKTTSTRKQYDPHKHKDDSVKYRVSPHMRKCTKYNGEYYDMGVCNFLIEEINN